VADGGFSIGFVVGMTAAVPVPYTVIDVVQALFTIECQLHRVTLALQGTLQEPSHSRFVLGYQDPHVTMLSELAEFIVAPRLHHRLLLF
jgi:hypothetical protein